MREEEARTLVGILVAAYPRQVFEQDTIDLYTSQLTRLQSVESAGKSVQALINSSKGFPSIAEIRATYGEYRRREELANAPKELDEARPSEEERKELAAQMRELSDNLSIARIDPEWNPVRGLEVLPGGECGDCKAERKPRYRYGTLALCRSCVIPRARVRDGMAEETRAQA